MQSKTKKIIIATSIIGAIVVLTGAIIIRSRRKKLQASIAEGSPEILEPAAANVSTSSVAFPLKKGYGRTDDEKAAVRVIQRYINAKKVTQFWLNIDTLDEDGLFGSLTENALYKLAGVKEVSWSLYKDMQNYLYPAPKYLSNDTLPEGMNIH